MSATSWWNEPLEQLLDRLNTTRNGLTDSEATNRQSSKTRIARNVISDDLVLLAGQFRNPISVLLAVTSILSLALKDRSDAVLILIILFCSVMLGFWQERSANRTVAKLLEMVQLRTNVLRDGNWQSISSNDVVAGDVVHLIAGSRVPADCRVISTKDLQLDESALTGESFPTEKRSDIAEPEAALPERHNALFLGSHVVSGTGEAVVVTTGRDTEFGRMSEHLKLRMPETEFEAGIRRFGFFLLQITLMLVVTIFAINVYLHKPIVESFLFALALSVGLTPQLLPAIITVNLTNGARQMAMRQAVVRKLGSIENLGSMDVLCSDKTGTLTEGTVRLHDTLDTHGNHSDTVARLAYLNSIHETGFSNPIDDAIRANPPANSESSAKFDEVPYDFVRKRLSVLVRSRQQNLLISKGAVSSIVDVCSESENANGDRVAFETVSMQVDEQARVLSQAGYRLLAVAYRDVGDSVIITRHDERQMIFVGFIVFSDPLKAGVVETIQDLRKIGVSLKLITGDNRWVATQVARDVGLSVDDLITGSELRRMSESALVQRAPETAVFAEIEPNQKEQIVLALRKSRHVVGYLGDGINDATALHAADVGISVDKAADVAKESADIVLLRKDLSVVVAGVIEGRKTFANTAKYIFMATSANFGNMFSMAGASLFLPFLPLLPHQILLENLLTDVPAMTISTDDVDPEFIAAPKRWNTNSIRNFMLVFGFLSSVFDYLTFGILILVMKVDTIGFRTCWFLESVCSAVLIVLVVRTRRPLFASRPGKALLWTTCAVLGVTLLLPTSPFAATLGFAPQPPEFFLVLTALVAAYIAAGELIKRCTLRRIPVGGQRNDSGMPA